MSRFTYFYRWAALICLFGLCHGLANAASKKHSTSTNAPPSANPPKTAASVAAQPSVKENKIVPLPDPGPLEKDKVVQTVGNALRHYHMLDVFEKKGITVVYRLDDQTSKTEYIVDVREFHIPTRAEKAEKPDKMDKLEKVEKADATRGMKHLFTVHVSRKTGHMMTDVENPGDFRPLDK